VSPQLAVALRQLGLEREQLSSDQRAHVIELLRAVDEVLRVARASSR
jgi:hypothetical protein